MAKKTGFYIKENISSGIAKFKASNPKVQEEALVKAGLQLLNWIVNGSPKESVVPPVLTGQLRGSGSVFVGNKFISATPDQSGKGEPNTSYNAPNNVITVGFNTSYAAKLHETAWNPGVGSQRSGNVGNKFIRKHLAADKDLLFSFIAKIYRSHY
jgi:hypothetical protein